MRDFIEVDDVELVRKALKAGVDPNGRDETELPWVVVAIRSDAVGCLKLLLDSGALADGPKGETLSPLVVALKMGKHKCCELLLQRGADANRLQAKKRTVLHVAAGLKSSPMQALIAAGALIDAQDERGWTPLMVAASDNRSESVRALLEAGCKTDLKEIESGKTAYQLAQAAGHNEICQLLKPASPLQPSASYGLCPVCQMALIPPARFCAGCGYRVEASVSPKKPPTPIKPAASESQQEQPIEATTKAAPSPTGKSWQRIGTAVLVVFVLGYQGLAMWPPIKFYWDRLVQYSSSSPSTTATAASTATASNASTSVTTHPQNTDWAGLWTGPKDRNGDSMEVVIDSNTLPCSGKVRGLYPGDAEFTASVTWSLKPGTDNVLEGKQKGDGKTITVAVARLEDSRLWGQARLVKPTAGLDGNLKEAGMITLDIDGYRRK